MRIEKEKQQDVIEIQESVKISQPGQNILLERGDKIRVLPKKESLDSWIEEIEQILKNLSQSYLDLTYVPNSIEITNKGIPYGSIQYKGNEYKVWMEQPPDKVFIEGFPHSNTKPHEPDGYSGFIRDLNRYIK